MTPVYIATADSWVSMNADTVPITPETVVSAQPTEATTYTHYGKTTVAWSAVRTGQTYTIATPGTYTNEDYAAYTTINAAGATAANPITVRSCRFRGPDTTDQALSQFLLRIINVVEVGAVIVENNLFDATVRYDKVESIRSGGNAIIRSNTVKHTVDGIGLTGGHNQVLGNKVMEGLLLPTTTQSDGKTHPDAIVIHGGDGDIIRGNDVSGYANAGLWLKAASVALYGQIVNAVLDGNWVDVSAPRVGGAEIHVFKTAADAPIIVTIINNIVGVYTNEVYVAQTVTATISGNVHPDGTDAKVTRFNAG